MGKKRINYIDLTKSPGWGQAFETDKEGATTASHEEMRTSLLFRIAAAVELATLDKAGLVRDRDDQAKKIAELELDLAKVKEREKRTEAYWRNAQNYAEKLRRSSVGLRGYIGRLKKRGR
jgi:hypothetical protein